LNSFWRNAASRWLTRSIMASFCAVTEEDNQNSLAKVPKPIPNSRVTHASNNPAISLVATGSLVSVSLLQKGFSFHGRASKLASPSAHSTCLWLKPQVQTKSAWLRASGRCGNQREWRKLADSQYCMSHPVRQGTTINPWKKR